MGESDDSKNFVRECPYRFFVWIGKRVNGKKRTHGRESDVGGADGRLILPDLEPDGAGGIPLGDIGAGGDLGEVGESRARVEDGRGRGEGDGIAGLDVEDAGVRPGTRGVELVAAHQAAGDIFDGTGALVIGGLPDDLPVGSGLAADCDGGEGVCAGGKHWSVTSSRS